jgi:hypothetical protein
MAYPMQSIALTTTATLNQDTHAETLIVINSTTGFTITMPAATGTGARYRFVQAVTVGSGTQVIAAAGTDVLMGTVAIATDIAGVTVPTTASSDKISFSGSTTGGLLGTYVELTDVASGKWLITGTLVSSGAEATPFSET